LRARLTPLNDLPEDIDVKSRRYDRDILSYRDIFKVGTCMVPSCQASCKCFERCCDG